MKYAERKKKRRAVYARGAAHRMAKPAPGGSETRGSSFHRCHPRRAWSLQHKSVQQDTPGIHGLPVNAHLRPGPGGIGARAPIHPTNLESLLAELGLDNEEIAVRMTGCPNGCSRPYLAEIGLVGKAPGKYQVYLGGNFAGTRLNRVYKDSVKTEEIIPELRVVLARFLNERLPGERFGDFCERAVLDSNSSGSAHSKT